MGASNSKTEMKRSTEQRRSQRKTLHQLKDKVEEHMKKIRKFKGIEENEEYDALQEGIERLKLEHTKRGKHLQPQVKVTHKIIQDLLKEAEELLDFKLNENKEKLKNKKTKKTKTASVIVSETEDEDDVESTKDEDISNKAWKKLEQMQLEQSTQKRQTVELNSIRIIPEEQDDNEERLTSVSSVQSPNATEKRKSILKMGVAVMPGAMMNELNQKKHTSISFSDDMEKTKNLNVLQQIDKIVEKLRNIELDINNFVGFKDSERYNLIKDELLIYLSDLDQMEVSSDGFDNWQKCRNYCTNCLSFLDERATDNVREQEKNNNVFVSNVNLAHYKSTEELNDAYKKLSKTTQI